MPYDSGCSHRRRQHPACSTVQPPIKRSRWSIVVPPPALCSPPHAIATASTAACRRSSAATPRKTPRSGSSRSTRIDLVAREGKGSAPPPTPGRLRPLTRLGDGDGREEEDKEEGQGPAASMASPVGSARGGRSVFSGALLKGVSALTSDHRKMVTRRPYGKKLGAE